MARRLIRFYYTAKEGEDFERNTFRRCPSCGHIVALADMNRRTEVHFEGTSTHPASRVGKSYNGHVDSYDTCKACAS